MQTREWTGSGRGHHSHPRFEFTGVVVLSNVRDALVARHGRGICGLIHAPAYRSRPAILIPIAALSASQRQRDEH